MERADKDLAFMLQYENVAWYDAGEVRILDRRVYPARKAFVVCKHHTEVMQAIRDMVTQSAGPYTAAPMGMALAAWECKDLSAEKQLAYLKKAANTIADARPTTKTRMIQVTDACIPVAERALEAGIPVDIAIREHVVEANNARYNKIARTAEYLVDMFPQNGTVMTQCFAETIVGMML
ncbi:MAG: S-methyl-5-thioribose-1-phosphate isomerase, partial [Sphaerochaeta sp.]